VKVVEAMRMNRVCVSTPKGVRGYDKYLVDKQDFILAKDDFSFAQQIVELVNDVKLCNQIAQSAKTKIDKYFSNEKFIEIVINTIKHHIS
jgi:spore maturation protein CgeB